MRSLDFSSWQAVMTTALGLVVATLLMVGIRLLVMETVQQRRQRENRQINERLRTLIAAYKTLGGSFTGDLLVNPMHLRDLLSRLPLADSVGAAESSGESSAPVPSDRARRIRDAVEGALSDVILLGTEAQVRMAAQAANDLVAGRSVRTDELVVSLRDFIRDVLGLEAVPATLAIPRQGPTRPSGGGGSGKGGGGTGGDRGDASNEGKGGDAGAMGAAAGGMGMGLGGGLTRSDPSDEGRDDASNSGRS